MTSTECPADQSSPNPFELIPPEIIEDPYEFYAMLRENAPVFHVEEHDIYVVTRHDLCLDALKRPGDFLQWTGAEMFAPGEGPALGPPELWSPEIREIMANGFENVNTLVTANAPEHSEYRSIVLNAFSAGRTAERMTARIYELADELIDGFASKGTAELVSELAVPLPVRVIAEILGVPPEDYATFKRWSDDSIVAIGGGVTPQRMIESAQSIVEFQQYFVEKIHERRAHPTDDVISVMVSATRSDGSPLDMGELLSILMQMLVAGNETTTSLIGSAIWRIVREPEVAAAVYADPTKIKNAVEEGLRIEAPVQGLFRRTQAEQKLGEFEIPADAKVLIMYGAANRDGNVYEDPDVFSVCRPKPSNHLGFGFGSHFCVGAALARKEANIALERVFARLPNLRLTEGKEIRHQMHPLLRGLTQLWVDFEVK